MAPTDTRRSRSTHLLGLSLIAGLLVVACGGDDDSEAVAPVTDAPEPTDAPVVTEAPEVTEATEAADPPDEIDAPDGTGTADGTGVIADWIALNEAYDAADTSDPFSDESEEATTLALTDAFALLPEPWPVPDEINFTASRGFYGWGDCAGGRAFVVALVDSDGVGIADGADRETVMALFEESFDDGAWDVDFEDDEAKVYRVVHEGVAWRLAIKDSGDSSTLDFCPLDE